MLIFPPKAIQFQASYQLNNKKTTSLIQPCLISLQFEGKHKNIKNWGELKNNDHIVEEFVI